MNDDEVHSEYDDTLELFGTKGSHVILRRTFDDSDEEQTFTIRGDQMQWLAENLTVLVNTVAAAIDEARSESSEGGSR